MTTDGTDRDGTLLGKRRGGPAPAGPNGAQPTVLGRRQQREAGPSQDAAPGDVRFGPGVATAPDEVASPAAVPRARRRRRTWWASALWALAIAVATVLLWLWLHPRHALSVSTVRVTVAPRTIGCGETAQVRAVVATNNGHGTITYRWRRGSAAPGPLMRYRVGDSSHSRAVLPLRWRIQGSGTLLAVATIDVIAPNPQQASARFSYVCP